MSPLLILNSTSSANLLLLGLRLGNVRPKLTPFESTNSNDALLSVCLPGSAATDTELESRGLLHLHTVCISTL